MRLAHFLAFDDYQTHSNKSYCMTNDISFKSKFNSFCDRSGAVAL